jgi:hypothetical protein
MDGMDVMLLQSRYYFCGIIYKAKPISYTSMKNSTNIKNSMKKAMKTANKQTENALLIFDDSHF